MLWHVAASTALFRWIFRDPRVDLRFLATGALLPDLIDLPLATALGFPGDAHRLWGHTLGVASLCMVLVLLTKRKGRTRKPWMALAVGVFLHLTLDAMWSLPETLFWPFLGVGFSATGVDSPGAFFASLGWWFVVGEVVGAVYLLLIWAWADREDRARFWSRGILRLGSPEDL